MPPEVVLRSILSASFIASVLRISTPIILPALGGLISDLAGVINIALDGGMLVSAFTGVVVSAYTHNVWIGLLAGMAAGVLISLLLGYFHLYLKADIILAGVAINIMASGATIFLLYVLTGDKGSSSSLPSGQVPNLNIPLVENIPWFGEVLSGHPLFTYLAFLLTWLVSIFLYRTRLGTHLRAVGENPEAAASVGINVLHTRFLAIGLSGFMAALGGLDLSMAYLTLFQREMTAGRGFIGLAAVFLGGRTPGGTLLAALLFGFFDAFATQIGSLKIPPQFVQMIPYAATILSLVIYSLRRQALANQRARRFREQHLSELAAQQNPND
jgi:simple sugar transport system permease protein